MRYPDMRSDFSTEDWIAHLKQYDIPALNDWLIGQAAKGVEYYRNRLDMLAFSGGRVLDAGCGAGNWTIALARCFEEVQAIDTDPIRLQIVTDLAPRLGNVETQFGSTESIEYQDEAFDAVFCSGVVFITDCEKTIREFGRILKTGGRLYMSFVGENWWRYLLLERGKSEPSCVKFGADGLISLFFRRVDELELGEVCSSETKLAVFEAVRALTPVMRPRFMDSQTAVYARFVSAKVGLTLDVIHEIVGLINRELNKVSNDKLLLRRATDARRLLETLVADIVPQVYRERIVRDFISRVLAGTSNYSFDVHTYTYEPEDMSELLMRHGFKDIQMASEGGLRLDSAALQHPLPIYPRAHGVYETLCIKA